ncbi:helix-turn-helix domain-containing protein [Actinomadura scrupuli]|uniref:helix-turn-helix domain-containing protein n=1 Tax=Actinomadura scrupuli TaxID=559629 RepID=UPI003D999251
MPIVRNPLDPKISFWHFLAYYLRFTREKQGLSLTQWGQIIGAARSSVSNMEAGRHKVQDDQVRLIDGHFGTGRLFELLLWYARTAHNPDWFRQYTGYERQALSIKIYHSQVIPLALQTDEYTWCYVQTGTFKDFDAEMAQRVARKRAILDREDPPYIWVLLDESALARVVGGPDVISAQLQRLLLLADKPNIIVRIVPFTGGAHLGADGPFQIIGLDNREIAYAGAQIGGRLIESPSEVREMSVMFDLIGAKAASEDASREIIKQYLERYL